MKTFLALTTGFLSGVIVSFTVIAAAYSDEIIGACAKLADNDDEEESIE